MTCNRGLLLVLLLLPVFASAQAPCLKLDWNYAEGYDYLGFFRVYISQTSGQYEFCGDDPQCLPAAIQAAIPEMTTEVSCQQVVVTAPGTYYLVVTAVSMDMKIESKPSNEISFTIPGSSPPPQETPPTAPPSGSPSPSPTTPPTIAELPKPPPWPTTVPYVPPQSSGGGGNAISQTCLWQGRDC